MKYSGIKINYNFLILRKGLFKYSFLINYEVENLVGTIQSSGINLNGKEDDKIFLIKGLLTLE